MLILHDMENKNRIGKPKSIVAGVFFILTASFAAVQFLWWFNQLEFSLFEIAPFWSIFVIACAVWSLFAVFLTESEKENKKFIIFGCCLLIVAYHLYAIRFTTGYQNPPELIMMAMSYPLNIGLAIGAIGAALRSPAISSRSYQRLSRCALQSR
jgi:FtsH-binding integral membrane protein